MKRASAPPAFVTTADPRLHDAEPSRTCAADRRHREAITSSARRSATAVRRLWVPSRPLALLPGRGTCSRNPRRRKTHERSPPPSIPRVAQWRERKVTIHRFAQVVGQQSPRRQHAARWLIQHFLSHSPGADITMRPGSGGEYTAFPPSLRLCRPPTGGHHAGRPHSPSPCSAQSVASFHHLTLEALTALGIDLASRSPIPSDLPDGTAVRRGRRDAAYDPPGRTANGRCSAKSPPSLRSSKPASPARPARSTTSGTPSTSPTGLRQRRPTAADPHRSPSRPTHGEVMSFGFWFRRCRLSATRLSLLTPPPSRPT